MNLIEGVGPHGQPILEQEEKMNAYCGHEGQTHEELAVDWILHHLTQSDGSIEEAKALAEYVLSKRLDKLVDDDVKRILGSSEETPCSAREDGMHCNCWYDGEKCCACGE